MLPKGKKIDGPTPNGGAYWIDTGDELVEVDTQGNPMGSPEKKPKAEKKPADG